MNGPDDSTENTLATAYKLIVQLMDFGFLFLGLVGCVAGVVSLVVGLRRITNYSEWLIFGGGTMLLVCLPMLMAWGFSHRLALVIRKQTRMQKDLDELLRRMKP